MVVRHRHHVPGVYGSARRIGGGGLGRRGLGVSGLYEHRPAAGGAGYGGDPATVLALLAQRYIVRGLTFGAVKG